VDLRNFEANTHEPNYIPGISFRWFWASPSYASKTDLS